MIIENIVSFVFNILLRIIFALVNIILIPIDAAINIAFPTLGSAFDDIADFLEMVSSGLGWAINATGIPYSAIALLSAFMIFKLTIPIQIWGIKLGLKWYKALK